MRAIVQGQGRETRNNIATFFAGEEAEAELLQPVGSRDSGVWWVRFDHDDTDRVRRIVRRLP